MQRYTDFSNAPGLANAPRKQQGQGGIGGFINNNRDFLRGLGIELLAKGLDSRNRFTGAGAMMGSKSDSDRRKSAQERAQAQQQATATADYLDKIGQSEAAGLMRAGQLGAGEAMSIIKAAKAGQGGEGVFGTPIYTQGEDGNLGVGVIGKDGSFKLLDTGGAKITQPTTMLDLGTQRVLAGSRTGETIRTDQIDNAGKAEQTAIGGARGEAQGEAIVGLPNAIAQANDAMNVIDNIANDPALPEITGMIQGRLPPMSQAGTDLNVKIQQLQGKTFLEAYQTLKGGGQITEVEGKKAEAAVARLNRAQSPEAYKSALMELKEVLQRGVARAKMKAGLTEEAPAPAGGIPEGIDPNVWEHMPPEDRALWNSQ